MWGVLGYLLISLPRGTTDLSSRKNFYYRRFIFRLVGVLGPIKRRLKGKFFWVLGVLDWLMARGNMVSIEKERNAME